MSEHQTAVTFDTAAFGEWLDSRTTADPESPTNRDASETLSTAYQVDDVGAGWLAEEVLDLMRGTDVWVYQPGVSAVQVWTAAGVETPTDGIVGEVTVDGFVLSLGRLTDFELIHAEHNVLPGYEAAGHVLTMLADRVNSTAAAFRQKLAGLVDIVDAEIVG